MPNSRHESQYKMIYYLYRNNTLPGHTMNLVWYVIRDKHNGFSKTIKYSPNEVKKEIIRQVNSVYENYDYSDFYPDKTHNDYRGFLTNLDIEDVIRITEGNMSEARLLGNIIKYCNPRRYRTFIPIHRDKFVGWGGVHTYLRYLDKFERLGVLKRGSAYLTGAFSKSLKPIWPYRNPDGAIVEDNRAPITFKDNIKQGFEWEVFRELLKQAGVKRTTAIDIVRRIYEVSKKDTHI